MNGKERIERARDIIEGELDLLRDWLRTTALEDVAPGVGEEEAEEFAQNAAADCEEMFREIEPRFTTVIAAFNDLPREE